MFIRFAIATALLFGFSTALHAAPVTVTFDLIDPSGMNGLAGEALETPGASFTDSGLTISVSATTTLGGGTGKFSAVTGQSGVDSDGVDSAGGDEASQLDAGEILTFTFTYAPAFTATLTEVDLQGVGGSDGLDAATVNVNGTSTTLYTGSVSGFAGVSDIWTTSGISVPSGGTIVVSTNDRIGLQSFTFDVVTIPEPSSAGLVCLGAIGWVARRRRSR